MDIKFFAKRAAIYANKKRLGGSKLKEGDKVYLLRQNIRTKRLSSKLDYKKLRAFTIKEAKGDINLELDLPITIRIHLVFYILLFKLALKNAVLKTKLKVELDFDKYKIKEILDLY